MIKDQVQLAYPHTNITIEVFLSTEYLRSSSTARLTNLLGGRLTAALASHVHDDPMDSKTPDPESTETQSSVASFVTDISASSIASEEQEPATEETSHAQLSLS